MKFNETFEELCNLYTEGGLWANINAKKKRGGKSAHGNSDAHKAAVKAGNKLEKGKSSDEEEDSEDGKDYRGRTPEQVAAIDKKMAEFRERSKKFAKENPYTAGGGHASPAPRKQEDNETSEDNEIVKGAAKLAGRAALGTAKLAGKAALGVADFVTHGDASKTIKTVKNAYMPPKEDCESCGCSDEEVEDCETCGCKENPEYGHFDDKFSDYIDQYEDAESEEQPDDDFFEALDDVLMVTGTENAHAVVGGMEVKLGRKLSPLETEHCHEMIQDDELPDEDAERVDKDRMKCNSPKRGGSKKFIVKACENGKEKVVRFGDPNMKIRKSNPKARKSFRARHKCDQKKSKFSAGYWSCKKW